MGGLLEEIEKRAKEMKSRDPEYGPLGSKPSLPTISNAASAFSSTTDFSKLNTGQHNARRADSFKTPQKLDKDFVVLDKRFAMQDSYSMIEICERAFSKKAEKLTREFMACAREEVRASTASLRAELNDK